MSVTAYSSANPSFLYFEFDSGKYEKVPFAAYARWIEKKSTRSTYPEGQLKDCDSDSKAEQPHVGYAVGDEGIKTIETLGPPTRRTTFSYKGSIQTGVILCQPGNPAVDAVFFAEALNYFSGKTAYGGFKEDEPTPGGFGDWVRKQSPQLNSRKLTPRHGSFIAAILCVEGGVQSKLHHNAVVMHFPSIGGK